MFFRIIYGVFILALILLISVFVLHQNIPIQSVGVHRVNVYAEYQQLSRNKIQSTVTPLLKDGYFLSSMHLIHRQLEALPWVESAEVSRTLPLNVTVRIKERKAVARWGDEYLLSTNGELFRVDNLKAFQSLPKLIGDINNVPLILKEYQRLSKQFESIGQSLTYYSVDKHLSRKLGLINGVEINIGTQNAQRRVNRFLEVYFAMFHDKFDQISYIDLRYPKGLSVKWKKGVLGT